MRDHCQNHVGGALVTVRVFKSMVLLAITLVICLSAPGVVQAQSTLTTVFAIANLHTFISPDFPLDIYSIAGQGLGYTYRMHPQNRRGGAIGLAIDEVNEHLFVTYEDINVIEVIDPRSAETITSITLAGTSDLCGIDVLESRSQLFVVDRDEPDIFVYNTTSYSAVSHWLLPGGNVAWGIALAEDVDGSDVIFVSDTTNTVRWYDIDSHQLVGSAVLTDSAIGIDVDNTGPEPVIFAVSVDISAHDPTYPAGNNLLQKYDVATGDTTSVVLPNCGSGIDVNELDNVVYVSIEPVPGSATLRVFDESNLNQLNSYTFPACGALSPCTPTDVISTPISYGTELEKDLTSHPGGIINPGDEVIFTVRLINKAYAAIHKVTLADNYNTQHLAYDHSVPASSDNVDDGHITWTNLIASVGQDLAPEGELEVELHFTAKEVICPNQVDGVNEAEISNVETPTGNPLPDSSAEADYSLTCGTAPTTTTTTHPSTTSTTQQTTTTTSEPPTTTVTTTPATTTTTVPADDDDWHPGDDTGADDDNGLWGDGDDTNNATDDEEEGWPKGKVTGGCCGC